MKEGNIGQVIDIETDREQGAPGHKKEDDSRNLSSTSTIWERLGIIHEILYHGPSDITGPRRIIPPRTDILEGDQCPD